MKYIVVGPEASGTHYVEELILANVGPRDTVHHRSLPLTLHEGDPRRPHYQGPNVETWPNLERFARELGGGGVTYVVCLRHPEATIRGQLRAGWSLTRQQARQKLWKAWRILGELLQQKEVVVVTYEGLATPGGRAGVLEQLGLSLRRDVEFVDGNAKYWEADRG